MRHIAITIRYGILTLRDCAYDVSVAEAALRAEVNDGDVLDAGREFAKKLSYGRVEKADAEGGSNGT